MTPGEWQDLSDSELRAKLEQRGWAALCMAPTLVLRRDDPEVAATIDRILGVER